MQKALCLALAMMSCLKQTSASAAGDLWVVLKNELKLCTSKKLSDAWDKTFTSGNFGAGSSVSNNALKDTGSGSAGTGREGQAAALLLVNVWGLNTGFAAAAGAALDERTLAEMGASGSNLGDTVAAGISADTTYSGDVMTKVQWLALHGASAKGDPHVSNMKGEKFDILKSGTRVMVEYPRESSSDPSLLVTAQIVRADAKWCENTFIESVHAHGSMLGSTVSFTMGKLRSPGPFNVKIDQKSMSLSEVVKHEVPLPAHGSYLSGDAAQMTLLSQGVSIRVELIKHSHFQFFNLDVGGLSSLPGEVGGLLGMADHSGEAHNDCKWKTHKTTLSVDDDSDDMSSLITAA